jgi:superfamily II DNA or RNA helicase
MVSKEFRISPNKGVVILPYNDAVANLIPNHGILERGGNKFMVVSHKHSETKLLNNLEVPVPPPVLTQYDWRGTVPFAAQEATAALLTTNPRAYVLNSIGTGKTRAAYFAADYLMQIGEMKRALIIAPLSTLTTVWDRELFEVFPTRSCRVIHGSYEKRLKLLKEDHDFYIINHDGVKLRKGALAEVIAARPDIDCVIIDELTGFKTVGTERWKAARKLIATKKWVWGMTGAPTPQAPTDAFGQIKLVTPSNLPTPHFRAFREMTMREVTQFKWAPRPDANEHIFDWMQPAVRFTQEDCVDLPPITFSTRSSEMTVTQKRAYNKMLNDMALEFQNREDNIVAANAGVQMGKLLQIASGFIYGGNHGKKVVFDHSNKLAVLKELIAEADKKVIIYCPFKAGVDELASLLAEDYDVEKVYGDTPKAKRDSVFTMFQHGASPKVLVAHPQVAAHGLTLTAASIIIWWSPTTSAEIYEQACGRIRRPGQDTHTHVVHIENSPVERKVYRSLEKKGNVQGELLQMFRDVTQT